MPPITLKKSPAESRAFISSSSRANEESRLFSDSISCPTHHQTDCMDEGKRRHVDSCQRIDPSSALPEDLLLRCLKFLDAKSLVRLRAVSRYYCKAASCNEAGWDYLCTQLWEGKVHVLSAARNDTACRMRAYKTSIQDSKRCFVLPEEFIFNPNTTASRRTVWNFRFKESAGADWTSADPWYQGQPCRKFVFLADGTVRQYQELPVVHDSPQQLCYTLTDPPLPMTWRFLHRRPMDLPSRPYGSYVRISVGGRDVPTFSVNRCISNWGFSMESCWGLYASFELPSRRLPQQHARRRRLRRTEEGGALWVVVDDEANGESSRNDFGDESIASDSAMDFNLLQFQDDSELTISNEVQWREAFLYNVGARVLPEGDEASEEFDRAWGGL